MHSYFRNTAIIFTSMNEKLRVSVICCIKLGLNYKMRTWMRIAGNNHFECLPSIKEDEKKKQMSFGKTPSYIHAYLKSREVRIITSNFCKLMFFASLPQRTQLQHTAGIPQISQKININKEMILCIQYVHCLHQQQIKGYNNK